MEKENKQMNRGYKSLNVGCGGDFRGDIRIDIVKSVKPTVVCDAHYLPFKMVPLN